MDNTSLIKQLTSSKLIAECPRCNEEFKLSSAILFDAEEQLPKEAQEKRDEMLAALKEMTDQLKKRKVSADAGAEKKAIEVGIGKIIEKIIPAYKDFSFPLSDCRPLFEPIDMIVFNGASKLSVDNITFLEIKTGKASLNKHEKMIRDAIDEKKVIYKEV